MLSYNHVLHGIPVDCMGLGGASGIAGEHCGSRAAHPCTPPHATVRPQLLLLFGPEGDMSARMGRASAPAAHL